MDDVTYERVLEDALTLPPEDRARLVEELTEKPRRKPLKSIEQLMAEQGTGPVSFEELRELGKFFPEEESVDDLVRTIDEWRGHNREMRHD